MDRLAVEVCGITFKTPLILGSGYITETPDFFLDAALFGCAAMVTRSLKKNPRPAVPAPRYYVHPPDGDWMLNAEWGNERPWNEWKERGVERVKEKGYPLIISLSGREIEECGELVDEFEPTKADGFEINVSCSHSGFLHGNLNLNPEHLQKLLARIRPRTRKPIWVKLSYSSDMTAMAQCAETHGADAIVITNSIGPGLMIDTARARPVLGIRGGCGGMTGSAIFPIALQCVWTICEAIRIPVIGVGGIRTSDQALQMLMAGARAVQLYTEPALRGKRAFHQITRGLERFLDDRAIPSLKEIIGSARGWASADHQFTAPPPVIVEAKCTGCGLCKPACAFDAIRFQKDAGRIVATLTEDCNGCNACVGVCPEDCIQPLF